MTNNNNPSDVTVELLPCGCGEEPHRVWHGDTTVECPYCEIKANSVDGWNRAMARAHHAAPSDALGEAEIEAAVFAERAYIFNKYATTPDRPYTVEMFECLKTDHPQLFKRYCESMKAALTAAKAVLGSPAGNEWARGMEEAAELCDSMKDEYLESAELYRNVNIQELNNRMSIGVGASICEERIRQRAAEARVKGEL